MLIKWWSREAGVVEAAEVDGKGFVVTEEADEKV